MGCTSADKYRKFIEKDPGLERRFQVIGGRGVWGSSFVGGWGRGPQGTHMTLVDRGAGEGIVSV